MDLYGLKEDSMEAATLGASVLVGAVVAKQVTGIAALNNLPAAKWVKPLIPIAVGVAVHSYGKGRFPVAAPGVAAGMVAFGVAGLVKAATNAADPYLPFNGLGFTYDSGLMGLGYSYGAGVDAYMNGAPTQVQSLQMAGMPVQVQSLQGLGSTIVGGSSPLSASLM